MKEREKETKKKNLLRRSRNTLDVVLERARPPRIALLLGP